MWGLTWRNLFLPRTWPHIGRFGSQTLVLMNSLSTLYVFVFWFLFVDDDFLHLCYLIINVLLNCSLSLTPRCPFVGLRCAHVGDHLSDTIDLPSKETWLLIYALPLLHSNGICMVCFCMMSSRYICRYMKTHITNRGHHWRSGNFFEKWVVFIDQE